MSKRTPLSPGDLNDQLAGPLQAWSLVDGALQREWVFTDFRMAWAFLTFVALVSEKLDHHAEIWNVYNRVRVNLSTHDPKGISGLDVEMAALLNQYPA